MEKNAIDLYELQLEIQSAIEGIARSNRWVRAEISALKGRAGGHCYMELSQNGPLGLLAKATAIIWSSRYRILSAYFESVTGSPLQVGMKVLVQVSVNFNPLYGLSLIVNDIDADYTLGDKEKERLATIARLQSEGLMDKQKSLTLPDLPRDFAVISAEDAAGYQDFMNHLHGNAYGFAFNTELYPAIMQGASAPESVADAFARIEASGKKYDAVLIMRGGGGKLDLACFDDYTLARSVAMCPYPVISGIGHDRDYHICDMVANTSVKTPTALADYLIDIYIEEDRMIMSYASRLKTAFLNKVALMSSKVDMLETRIKSSDPRRILARGYVLALNSSKVVMKSASSASKGDEVLLMFADGQLNCEVK